MKLRHLEPCSECPWRLVAPQGWLGGHTPELYADAVANNEVPACHLRDFGPLNPRTSMCAGSLATARNACILPHKTIDGREAAIAVGKRDDCFKNPRDFFEYHAQRPYVPFILRKIEA